MLARNRAVQSQIQSEHIHSRLSEEAEEPAFLVLLNGLAPAILG